MFFGGMLTGAGEAYQVVFDACMARNIVVALTMPH